MQNNKRRKTAKPNKYNNMNLSLETIEPLNQKQEAMFDSNKHIVAHGSAGTGKTFIATYLAFKDILKEKYDKLVYIRSAVPTRNMGFLPGTEKEKAEVYELPYKDIATELFQRGDAYEVLKLKGGINFMTTSFIRGTTLNDSAIIVDEFQNMSFHELDSIITRVGSNCRIFFCGDTDQSDLPDTGINNFNKILKAMNSDFDFIEFNIEDIVRSEFVKQYLTTKYKVLNESRSK